MSLFHLDRPALHALNESEAEKTPSQFESKNRADLRRFELLSEFFSHPPTHERIQLLESSGINLKTMTLKQLVTHFVGYKTDYYNLANFRASFFSTWSACGDPRACDNCHQVSCPYGSSVLTAGSNTTQKKRPRVSSFELPDQPPRSSSTNSPLLDSLEELNHYDPTEHATLSQPQTSGFSTSLEASERSYSWPSCQHPTGLEATADNMTLIRAFEGCGRPDLHIKLSVSSLRLRVATIHRNLTNELNRWFQQCLTISKLKNTPVNKVRKDFDESAAQPLEGTMTPLSFDLPDESVRQYSFFAQSTRRTLH